MSETALALRNVARIFRQGDRTLEVLRGVTLEISRGEIVALVGQSGSGKSTLLHIAGLLERPDSGEILLEGHPCGGLSDLERTRVRREALGFVYQFHHLLPEFSAEENVMMPMMIAGSGRAEARRQSVDLLTSLGLGERLSHRPARLSGGEQQRVAIARALVNRPRLLLADEPTGNLDPRTAERVFEEMVGLVRSAGLAALVATHNPDLARRMDRVLVLDEGRVTVK